MPLKLGQVLFSGRTYQIEVDDYWVFLQLTEGLATDVFCSCGEESCAHALFAIKLFQDKEPPHKRFERSFFRKVFFAIQSEEPPKEQHEGVFRAPLCTIRTYDPIVKHLLREPSQEMETNSIKFSDRSPQEIEKWRQGRPTPDFAFELSVWSDIAKHYFVRQIFHNASVRKERSTFFVDKDSVETGMDELPPLDEERVKKELSWSFQRGQLIIEGELYTPELLQKRSAELRLLGFPLFESEAALPVKIEVDEQVRVEVEGTFYGPYVWLEGKGFFLKPPYPAVIKDLSAFIKEHPGCLPVHHEIPRLPITFTMEKGGIRFFSAIGKLFEDWIYIEDEGFYPRIAHGKRCLTGLEVSWEKLPEFIEQNEEALAEVEGFFLKEKPFQRFGVRISVLKGKILVTPTVDEPYEWKLLKNYFIVLGRGVYPLDEPFPEVMKETLITTESESFIHSELPKFLPFALEVDPRLKPLHPRLMTKPDIHYRSEFGRLDIYDMAKTLQLGHALYLTPHGYVNLKDPRFEWLQRLDPQGITPLDKVRIEAYEKVEALWPEEKPLPAVPHFHATLRNYQQSGVEWLWGLYQVGLSAILCDDMGLGKTYQALGFVASVNKGRTLILAPTSVLYHWYDKVRSCLPELKVNLFHGSDRKMDPDADIIITSYSLARIEREKLAPIPFEIIIFDEIQMAKNRLSMTWSSLIGLKSYFRLGLTGTPIENNLKELKSLFDLVLPGFFLSNHRFREQFIVPIEVYGDDSRKELLKRLVAPFILRRKKTECLKELPAKTEDVLWCTLSDEQKILYQQILQEHHAVIEDLRSVDFSYITLLALLIQLKKICNHPALYLKDIKNWRNHESSKWQLFVELLEEALDGGQKVVVFSHYLGMLDIIEDYLQERHIGFASVRGSTINRQNQVARFQTEDSCRVFVASLQAAGLGIDLTAGSTVIHYDRWWNAARENQATDRVYRLGQKLPVQVFKLATRDTIEERIDKLIAKKAQLLEDIMSFNGQTDFKRLTQEDWLEILSCLESVK